MATKTKTKLLQAFGRNIWFADGPVVNFYGFSYPTRMVAIKLQDNCAWLWSPIQYSEELATEIERLCGPIRHIVSPNKIHWLFLKMWSEIFPKAKLYASPGLSERKIACDLPFDTVLNDSPDASYASDIDQVIFKSPMDEVVFFHKCSKTVIFCDLIQRFPESRGWKGWLMTADGLVGERGSTPKEWRFLFWWTGKLDAARLSLEKVLYEWQPERLIIAHGHCASSNATQIIDHCLTWIPRDCAPSRERCCGCGRQSG